MLFVRSRLDRIPRIVQECVAITLLCATLNSLVLAQPAFGPPGPQTCSVAPPPYPGGTGQGYALYPASPGLTYPMMSTLYAVQYKIGAATTWTDGQVYISVYGGTNSSPYTSYSGNYTQPTSISSATSMSFVSIPVPAGTDVTLRVTKLWNAPFVAGDSVSIRPGARNIPATLQMDGSVEIATSTDASFAGEQFILWWNRNSAENAALQSLVFFLDPAYVAPSGANVKTVTQGSDLNGDLSAFDTLLVQGTVQVAVPGSVEPAGAQAFVLPSNITSIFLDAGSWLQGKLAFSQPTKGVIPQVKVSGPGVLDVSRFEYDLRKCGASSGFEEQGYAGLAVLNPDGIHQLKNLTVDGIVIIDDNWKATDKLTNSTVNNLKIINWNGNNDGIEMGLNATVSNVFVRAGDDSLKLWDSKDTVTNATVWQTYNGSVVNLSWFDNNPGQNGLIDGLYVVKTDWDEPTSPTWMADAANILVHQNNGVIVSMMNPGTSFGAVNTSLYQNIFLDDPPQVLFSLKIIPPALYNPPLYDMIDLTASSVLNLNIENLVTPPSTVESSIGFQTLPPGYTCYTGQSFPAASYPSGYTLTGDMNISLTHVMLKLPDGSLTPLSSANASTNTVPPGIGNISTNGSVVNIFYDDIFASGFQ